MKSGFSPFSACLSLALLGMMAACVSNDPKAPAPPVAASKLHYTPHPDAQASAWRLELASGQDTSQLVFNVMGPTGLVTKGASFFVTCDSTRVSWGDTSVGTTFNLGASPQIFRAKAGSSAGELQVGIYQKQGAATLGAQPMVRLTLGLLPNVQASTISLGTLASGPGIYLDGSGQSHAIPALLVGELKAVW